MVMSNKIFAVVSCDDESYHLIGIYTNSITAQGISCLNTSYSIKEFDYLDSFDVSKPFPVYVVSVGLGSRYRILEITPDKKRASKIASSIRGKMTQYDAMPSLKNCHNIKYYKFFILLEDHKGEDFYYVDHFLRPMSLYVDQDAPPIVTRRRKYNSSLPYRFEVSAPDQIVAETITLQLCRKWSSSELDENIFEYNVDYTMVKDDDDNWEIEPCLLDAANVR